MENKALGKGLSALIPDRSDLKKGEVVAYLNVNLVQYNRFQPRTNYDDTKLNDLKASIKEKGVLQPILVRKQGEQYEVIAGERRLRAAKLLNFQEVPAIIKDVSDQDALVLALIENIQREELNPVEEANAYKKLIKEFQFTHESVAQSVGKDRSTITNALRLLKLSENILNGLYRGEISVGHARAILSVDSQKIQDKLYDQTLKKGLSVRELENLSKAHSGGGSRREKIKSTQDPEILALEEDLQKVLGTKVRILSKKKRGKISIDYYSSEDLGRIVEIIKR